MTVNPAIAAFNARRDAILLAGDIETMIELIHEQSGHRMTQTAAEILMHKCRTATVSLPRELRKASHDWLVERGLEPYDDGDL